MGRGKGEPRRNGYFLLELGGRIVSRKVVKRIQAFSYYYWDLCTTVMVFSFPFLLTELLVHPATGL